MWNAYAVPGFLIQIFADNFCIFQRLNEIENSLLVFVVATYGEGDPTDNMQTSYDWIKSDGKESSSVY